MGSHLSCTDVGAIQMPTKNICLYKEVDQKYTGCNLKTTKLLDYALIGVCAVIRSIMVVKGSMSHLVLTIAPGQEANGSYLGMSFRSSIK